MTSCRCRMCRSLCGTSTLTHFLLGVVILSLPVILLTNHMSRPHHLHNSRTSREYLVNWQPSLNDSNVSLILQEHRNPYRPLVFVPFRHTGGEFLSFAIKQTISAQHLGVKTFDVTKSDKAASREVQREEIQTIFRNESKDQLLFIESNIINLNIKKYHGKEPLLVTVIRDPFEVLLSCYHQKKYGNTLYRAFETSSVSEFKDRLNNLTSSFEKCVLQNHHCTKGLLGTMSMVKSFSGMSLPSATSKRYWANKAMPQAKSNIAANSIVVGVMEDFNFLPFMLERIAPKVCQNLWYLFNMNQLPPWAFTSANISDTVKDIIKRTDLNMLFEHRFYNWIKARYERLKRFGFIQFVE